MRVILDSRMSSLPWMPELGELAVVVERVVTLVAQSGGVGADLLLAGEDVEVGVSGALDPVVRPRLGVEVPAGHVLPHAVEQRHQRSFLDVRLGEQPLARLGPAIIIIVNNNITATFFCQDRKTFIRCFIYLIAAFTINTGSGANILIQIFINESMKV